MNRPIQSVTFACGHRRFYTSRELLHPAYSEPFLKFEATMPLAPNAWQSGRDCCCCLAKITPDDERGYVRKVRPAEFARPRERRPVRREQKQGEPSKAALTGAAVLSKGGRWSR